MIPVPLPVRESLAQRFATTADALTHFGGGREDSDGVIYAYGQGDGRRLLKVMAISLEEQRRGLFYLEERLRFMEYLGKHGAPVVYPQLSPQGALYETCSAYRRILLFTVMQGWISSKPDRLASWKRMIVTSPRIVGTF